MRLPRVILIAVGIVYFLAPFLWILLAPTKTDPELVSLNPFAFGSLSNVVTAWNNLLLFNDGIFVRWIFNSLAYTFAILVITLVTTIPAGYALAIYRFPGRSLTLKVTLIAMLMPITGLVIPLFLEMHTLGLVNSPWAFILPSGLFAFGVYLTAIFYQTSLPPDLLDAARADGCGEWRVFTRIALPLSRGIVGLVTFFAFIGAWNNFFLPYVMITSTDQLTLPVGLGALVSGTPALNPAIGASFLPIRRPEVALAGLIIALPVLVLFIVTGKLLARGVFEGAVKS